MHAANTSTALDESQIAKPRIAVTTPTYIGLRVKRYNPPVTSARGGSYGAGVPRPRRAKSRAHQSSSAHPAAMSARPIHRHGASGARHGDESRPAMKSGSHPAMAPGIT